MEKKNAPFAIYARKSSESEDRQVLSIDSQIKELKELATKMGVKETPIVFKESMSAKAPGRPVFNKLMGLVETGKIAGILCWKLDRLARNPVDGGRIIWDIKSFDFEIATPSQGYSKEEDNVILMYIEFGMAQKYIDDLGRNVKRGNREKLEAGGLPGVPPIGYINKLEGHTIIPDPDRFVLIRKMWDLVLDNKYTPEQVRRTANEEWGFKTRKFKRMGDKPLTTSAIYRILRSPFYYGTIKRKVDGELKEYQGAHLPMITEEEFWKAQEILGFPVPKPKIKSFPLSGLIRCEVCGSAISAYEKKGKYVFYRCSGKTRKGCGQPQIKAEVLEAEVTNKLEAIKLPELFTSWARKWLKEANSTETTDTTFIHKSLQDSYNTTQTKLNNLTDALIDELIEKNDFKKRKEELLREQKRIREKINDVEKQAENWLDKIEKAFDFASEAKERFNKGFPETKRQVAIDLGVSFILKKGGILLIEPREMWQKFEQYAPKLNNDIQVIELAKNGQGKEKTMAFESMISSWQGR